MICGNVAVRIGFGNAYRIALFLQTAAVAMLALSPGMPVLVISTVILGIFMPGIVPLVLGRIHELVPHDHIEQRAAWSRATTAFALFQALGGYGYSFLFSHTNNNYTLIFSLGATALSLALIADFIANFAASRQGAARQR